MIRFKIFLVFAFLLSTATCTLPTSFAHSQTQVIEMTSWGFQPQMVSLDNNSAVIFVNKDSKAHWPASDVHPTHDLYPEFDPQKAVEPGQSWPFRPKKVGVWRFHDHLFPHIRGTMIITQEKGQSTEKSNNENKFEKVFLKVKDWIVSLYDKFSSSIKPKKVTRPEEFIKLPQANQIKTIEDMAKTNGAEKSWNYIKDTFKGQLGSSGNIHDLAHLAGNLIYKEKGFPGITLCSKDFAFGCYHGFLDQAFKNDLSHLIDAQNACLKLGPDGSGSRSVDMNVTGPAASCIHGIGHGVASFYSVTDLEKSLSSCQTLTSGSQYCFDGVFMELERSAPADFYKKEDLTFPCDDLESKFGPIYSFSCGRNQPTVLISRFKLGFGEVINICLNSDSGPFKQACFDSLGFMVAEGGDVSQIIQNCQQIGDSAFSFRCIKSAAGELVFQEIPGWYEKSKEVCSSLDSTQSNECIQYVDSIVYQYNRSPGK